MQEVLRYLMRLVSPVNLLVVPCSLMIIFAYIFIGKIGEMHTKYFLSYIAKLICLHALLAIPKLAHYKLAYMNITCKLVSYVSYYFILVCFSWLSVMCLFVRRNICYYRKLLKSTNVKVAINKQTEVNRFMASWIIAHGFSLFTTALVATGDIYLSPDELHYCMRLQDDSRNYVFAPVLLVMAFGTFCYAQTIVLIRRANRELCLRAFDFHKQFDPESRRFSIYLRLFVTMFVAWFVFIFLFIFIDSLLFHVVTIINLLHTIALLSILYQFFDMSPRKIIKR